MGKYLSETMTPAQIEEALRYAGCFNSGMKEPPKMSKVEEVAREPLRIVNPEPKFRWRGGVLQQRYGVQIWTADLKTLLGLAAEWVDVPTVPDDAPDQE